MTSCFKIGEIEIVKIMNFKGKMIVSEVMVKLFFKTAAYSVYD